MKKYKIIAHRGIYNNKNVPENSLKAFRRSIIENYPIELDIQLTKDNKIVVFHDLDLKRMTNKDGFINTSTLKDLKKLYLLNTEEKIPTLDEVLELVRGKVSIYIEVKSINNIKKISDLLIKTIKNYNGEIFIMSFNPLILKYLKYKKKYKYGLLSLKKLPNKLLLKLINPDFIAISKNIINNKKLKKLEQKYYIYLWTIKSKKELEKYNNYNYFYICNNLPY